MLLTRTPDLAHDQDEDYGIAPMRALVNAGIGAVTIWSVLIALLIAALR
jgi:hypothetical protein